MALQTVTTIKIGETIITNFSKLEIIQKIHDHHSFSIEVRQDLLVEEFKSVMPVSQQLSGEKVSIEIKPLPGLDDLMINTNPNDYIMQFYGVVTNIKIQKSRNKDIEKSILIKGKSTSILLDGGKECNSFTNMSIADVVNKVKSGYDIDMEVIPLHKNNLAYTVQYNESDFDFLNRLARQNGEWFYSNGRKMIFGDAGGPLQPKLIYGINMHDFSYDIKLLPTKFKTIENDNRSGEYYTDNTTSYRNEIDGFHQNSINKSNQVFTKETVLQLNQNSVGANGKSTLEEYTKNKMRFVMSGLMQVKASSEVPGITIGNDVSIKGLDKQLESNYRVIKIKHVCDDGGGYQNYFTAVNFAGSSFSPKTNPDLIANCKSQTAVVIENTDPDGLSGVKVQMPWQAAKGEITPYIPLIQKYGGDARGSHIIPEIGDTVFVDFQGNNAELPIVIGTMTSKKEKSGYSTPNNDIKAVMHSRSGNRIINDDATGDITIESQKGQTIAVVHGDGNIRFKAPKSIELEAGEDIVMKAGKNVKIDAKEDIEVDAGYNIFQEAQNDIYVNANGNIMEKSDNRTELVDKDFSRTSDISNEIASKASLYSHEEDMTIQSGKQVRINSTEKSNLF
ncbi:contractile injection system protein, VgrG/Pvc8 family [Flavobacterium sp. YJ01]|uniref:contractile injection system protein, VgrG/Pvc8 family n=1 Tax=unclassified Flavobacterium TaxID=196869 RepID=UPI0023E3F57C|nr:contractile injection system protein, VgrG/Pvc8 family [Flavobacterium sp. YJ01]WET01689.1 contractile injection system protein, VgrG/Pvc8 family [Flavobacterium sp. YJ01]